MRQSPLVLLGCLALSAVFIHHAVNGRHGLEARSRLTARLVAVEQEIQRLEAVRVRLQRDVALLAADAPDPDLVDETARLVLGYSRPGERVVTLPSR